jgi:hypothetical protein
MRVLVRGKVWRLVHTRSLPKDVDGECDAPSTKKKQIRIRAEIKDQRLLDVYVHELIHACLWDLGEGPVASLANAVAHDLWNDGLRTGHKSSKTNLDKLEHEITSVLWPRGEIAVIDEDVRREISHTVARLLNRLGWAFE